MITLVQLELQVKDLTRKVNYLLHLGGGGSTGLPSLGTASQQLRVNAGATALEYFTPTAAVSPLLPTTGTGTATGAVIGSLAGNTLNIQQGANAFLSIDPSAGAEQAALQAYNTTDNDNYSVLANVASNTSASATLAAAFNGESKVAIIQLTSNVTDATAAYTADTHTFNIDTTAGLFSVSDGSINYIRVDAGGDDKIDLNTEVGHSIRLGADYDGIRLLTNAGPEITMDVGDNLITLAGGIRVAALAGNGTGIVAVDDEGDLSFSSGGGTSFLPTTGTGTATGDITGNLGDNWLEIIADNSALARINQLNDGKIQLTSGHDTDGHGADIVINAGLYFGGGDLNGGSVLIQSEPSLGSGIPGNIFLKLEGGGKFIVGPATITQDRGLLIDFTTFHYEFGDIDGSSNGIKIAIDNTSEAITHTAEHHIFNDGIQEFSDNAAAVTGGLAVGTLYRTGDVVKIVHA